MYPLKKKISKVPIHYVSVTDFFAQDICISFHHGYHWFHFCNDFQEKTSTIAPNCQQPLYVMCHTELTNVVSLDPLKVVT